MVLKSLGLDFLGDLFLQGGGGEEEGGLGFLLLLEGIVYFIIQQFTPAPSQEGWEFFNGRICTPKT